MFLKHDFIGASAAEIRGWMINETILLERLMDSFFAGYFCNTKKKGTEFKELFISTERITFEMKRQALKIILKKLYPEIEKIFPTFYPDLVKVMEQRNIMAHYELDISKKSKKRYPKEIGFIKYKNETDTIWYSNKQLESHLMIICKCQDTMIKILKDDFESTPNALGLIS